MSYRLSQSPGEKNQWAREHDAARSREPSAIAVRSLAAAATRLMARVERMLIFPARFPARPFPVERDRLVAAMVVHGVSHILTFNTQDFTRYAGVRTLHPTDVV